MVALRTVLCVLVVWLAVTANGQAQTIAPACDGGGQIIRSADFILKNRGRLIRFDRRGFGARAAYLKMRYGNLGLEEGQRLVAPLVAAQVHGAADLAAAHAITHAGVERGLAMLADDPLEAFAALGQSARRAAILADGGETYLAFVGRLRAEGAKVPPQFRPGQHGASTWFLVVDRPDIFKAGFAKEAAYRGFRGLAAMTLASMTDLRGYEAFVAAHAGDPLVKHVTPGTPDVGFVIAAHHDTGPGEPQPAVPEAKRAELRQLYSVVRAGYHTGEADILNIFLNETGKLHEAAGVADAFWREVGRGVLDPARDPEGAWIFQVTGLVHAAGLGAVDEALSAFDLQAIRHFRGTARKMLDWIVAARALTPRVTGSAWVPPRPDLLSAGFDWKLWTAVAGTIAQDGTEAFLQTDLDTTRIAVELLFAAGRYDALSDLVDARFEPRDAVRIHQDIMLRLDRRCAAHAVFPGEALLLGGTPLFDFAPRGVP